MTLNLCRAFTTGGYADLHQVHAWNQDFVRQSQLGGQRYERLAGEIDRALAFMRACGADPDELRTRRVLLQPRGPAAALRAGADQDRLRAPGSCYDLSAHFLWIGERTRALDGAHVEFAAAIRNPIGVKVGPGRHPGRSCGRWSGSSTRTASPAG